MKRYKLLKDYATPFCFVPAGTVGEKDGGYYNFTSGEDGFSFPAQDVRKAPNWFEEIKESESQEKCRNAWHPKDCPGHQPKEECKHENAKELDRFMGLRVFSCPDCPGNTWKIINGELFAGETKPKQEQLEPSDWIAERADDVARADGVHKTVEQQFIRSILDFLDSVAEGKYKLEP